MSRDDVRPGDSRPILVTGGAGFIGCNIADRLAAEGHEVIVYDALVRPGVERNLDWLRSRHGSRICPVISDICDQDTLARVAREAKAVFHLAAQVAVTASLDDPRRDFRVNVEATLNLLEALRSGRDEIPLLFASTNKVYGDLAGIAFRLDDDRYVPVDRELAGRGIAEDRPLDFHTPYGCSKGAADQYVLDYARTFGMPAAVLRMSCVYGRRQMGSEDQGWVAHFLIRALAGEPIAIYGDGFQVRDILDVSDAVQAYLSAWRRIDLVKGRAFNLGGGPDNAVSLRRLVAYMSDLIGREIDLRFAGLRAGDQRYFVADTSAARAMLDLPRPLPWRTGVARLAEWIEKEREPAPAEPSILAGAMA